MIALTHSCGIRKLTVRPAELWEATGDTVVLAAHVLHAAPLLVHYNATDSCICCVISLRKTDPARSLPPAAFNLVNNTCISVTTRTHCGNYTTDLYLVHRNKMKRAAAFAFLVLLFSAASASWDSLDSIQLASELEPVNEDIIPRLLQEVLSDAAVPGAYGVSASACESGKLLIAWRNGINNIKLCDMLIAPAKFSSSDYHQQ
jgi:hypothetical protein